MNKSKYKHGQWFKAVIKGVSCVGKVSINKNGYIYLCQDKQDGLKTNNTLSFKYSWGINSGTDECLDVNGVTLLKLSSTKPKPYKIPKLPNVGPYETLLIHTPETLAINQPKKIKVGCTKISRELYLEIGRLVNWIE